MAARTCRVIKDKITSILKHIDKLNHNDKKSLSPSRDCFEIFLLYPFGLTIPGRSVAPILNRPYEAGFDVGFGGNTSHVLDAVDVREELKIIGPCQ
jgi:hypothetical protein